MLKRQRHSLFPRTVLMCEARELETCGELQKPVAGKVGRECEGCGLLNPPARFAQTDFHVFCFLPSAAEFELQDSADAFVGPLPDSASHASRTAMRDGTAFAEPSIPSRRK